MRISKKWNPLIHEILVKFYQRKLQLGKGCGDTHYSKINDLMKFYQDLIRGSFHVISITTRHDACLIQPNSVHDFIHPNYSHNREHLAGDACACAERHTKITRRHITQSTLKINFNMSLTEKKTFTAKLPVLSRSNKRAWRKLNEKMKRQKLNIRLFLDNANCHPCTELRNV